MGKLQKLIEQFLLIPAEARFDDVVYLLRAFGFVEKRSKGSHHIFEDEVGRVIRDLQSNKIPILRWRGFAAPSQNWDFIFFLVPYSS